MRDVSEVVEGTADANLVHVLLADLQMLPAADGGLLELPHHLQRVAQVPRGLGLTQPVAHGPRQGEVVFVELGKEQWHFKERSVFIEQHFLIRAFSLEGYLLAGLSLGWVIS